MQAKIEDGHLIVRVPLKREPHPSHSGLSLIIASAGPRKTTATIDGKSVTLRLTAWTPRPDADRPDAVKRKRGKA
jgi:hypothetical protein